MNNKDIPAGWAPTEQLEQLAIRALKRLADSYENADYRSSTIGYIQVLEGRAIIRKIAAERAALAELEVKTP